MRQFMKGFKTVALGVTATLVGGATAGGFFTPELGAQVSSSVQDAITTMEQTIGAIEGLIGVLVIAARAVTDTPIFKQQ